MVAAPLVFPVIICIDDVGFSTFCYGDSWPISPPVSPSVGQLRRIGLNVCKLLIADIACLRSDDKRTSNSD